MVAQMFNKTEMRSLGLQDIFNLIFIMHRIYHSVQGPIQTNTTTYSFDGVVVKRIRQNVPFNGILRQSSLLFRYTSTRSAAYWIFKYGKMYSKIQSACQVGFPFENVHFILLLP